MQSLFFSPKKPSEGGLIWGVGPVLLLPTGSDDLLSAKKWGAGPTGVVLKQVGPWTVGALANHLWSVGGSGNQDISSTFLQPFVSYTTPTAWSFALNTESTYDWEREQWAVPVNAVVSKVTRLGDQLVSFGAGARYWADSPDSGPHGWGFRLVLTFLCFRVEGGTRNETISGHWVRADRRGRRLRQVEQPPQRSSSSMPPTRSTSVATSSP